MNLFAFRIVCPYCGNKHRSNKEGICPHCNKRYLLSQSSSPKIPFAAIFRGLGELATGVKDEISDFLSHTNTRQKQLLLGMVAIMAVILVLFISAAVNLSTPDPNQYVAPESTGIPCIYYTGSTAHFLFKDGKTAELGIGDVEKFDFSADGSIMYILFSGRITADVDSAQEGDYVVRIDNGKNLEIVAKGDVGKVSYLTGGNCEHLYFILPESSGVSVNGNASDESVDKEILDAMEYYSNISSQVTTSEDPDNSEQAASGEQQQETKEQSVTATVMSLSQLGEYTLYYSHRRGTGRVIAENLTSTDMVVSPNGRYLIYCAADSEGSELVKYRVSKKNSEETGVKNARALSVDNKGRFFTYVKANAEGKMNLSYCRNAEDKITVTLPDRAAREIVFSADMHSFALRFDDYTIFKSASDSQFRTVNFDTTSDFGYKRNVYAQTVSMEQDDISSDFSVLEGDLFPFFYYDASGRTIYRVLENGSKSPYLDVAIEDAAVSDNGVLAYIAGDTLYTGKLSSGRNSKRTIATNFSYDLYDISPDGKTLYLSDPQSGRYFTLPTNSADGTNPELLTENTAFIKASSDSKMLFYTKGSEAYLKRSAGTPRLTDSNIIADDTCVFTTDFSQFVYAKDMGSDTKGNRKISLYIYREGKPMFVTENLTGFITADGTGFTESRTDRIFPSQATGGDNTVNGTMIIQ